MRDLRHISAIVLTTLVLAGCGNGADTGGGADAGGCKDAVAEAAQATDLADDTNLQPAFDACQDLAEFGSAVQESPEIAEEIGSDVEGWVRDQCQGSDTLSGTMLCESAQ